MPGQEACLQTTPWQGHAGNPAYDQQNPGRLRNGGACTGSAGVIDSLMIVSTSSEAGHYPADVPAGISDLLQKSHTSQNYSTKSIVNNRRS